jgi:hypothetical protein
VIFLRLESSQFLTLKEEDREMKIKQIFIIATVVLMAAVVVSPVLATDEIE